MAKKTKTSTAPKKVPKKPGRKKGAVTENFKYFDEYRDMMTGRMTPISQKAIEAIASDLVEWAKNNQNAIKVQQFYLDLNINPSTWDKWVRESPHLYEANEFAKAAIGVRREMGALKKKYDASTVAFMMPNYDKDWARMTEWRSKLKSKENEAKQDGPPVVILERYPDSSLVPPKPTPEEVAMEARRKTAGNAATHHYDKPIKTESEE